MTRELLRLGGLFCALAALWTFRRARAAAAAAREYEALQRAMGRAGGGDYDPD